MDTLTVRIIGDLTPLNRSVNQGVSNATRMLQAGFNETIRSIEHGFNQLGRSVDNVMRAIVRSSQNANHQMSVSMQSALRANTNALEASLRHQEMLYRNAWQSAARSHIASLDGTRAASQSTFSGIVSSITSTASSFIGLGGSISGIGIGIFTIGTIASSVFSAVQNLISSLTTQVYELGRSFVELGLKTTISWDMIKVRFNMLWGDIKGPEVFTGLKKWAEWTPFTLDDILDPAARLSIAFKTIGWNADSLIPAITKLGDGIAATGGRWSTTALAIQQMASKGKIMAQEMNQLSDSMPGVDLWGILAKHYKMTTQEMRDFVREGVVPAKEAIPVLIDGIQNTSGVMGIMVKQSKTLGGRLSTLSDQWRQFAVDFVKPIVPSLTNLVMVFGNTVIPQLRQKWYDFWYGMQTPTPAPAPVSSNPMVAAATLMHPAIAPVMDTGFEGKIKGVIERIKGYWRELSPLLQEPFEKLKTIDWSKMWDALVTVKNWIVENKDIFIHAIHDVFGIVKWTFEVGIPTAIKWTGAAIVAVVAIWEGFKKVLAAGLIGLVTIIAYVVEIIMQTVFTILWPITKIWDEVFGTNLTETLQNSVKAVNDYKNKINDKLNEIINPDIKVSMDTSRIESKIAYINRRIRELGLNLQAMSYGQVAAVHMYGYASGGYPPTDGKPFWVGEQGPELMSVRSGIARVLSASQSKSHSKSYSESNTSSVNLTVNVNVASGMSGGYRSTDTREIARAVEAALKPEKLAALVDQGRRKRNNDYPARSRL